MLLNHLKYRRIESKSKSIGGEKIPGEIIPLAQEDMIEQFLMGIDSNFDTYLINEMLRIFESASTEIIQKDRKISAEDKNRLKKKFAKRQEPLMEYLVTKSLDFQIGKHYYPTVRILAILPKDELAAMAETLVNLTSFKRRVSTSSETVGGPIDVAVISRGDGFVWVKRKQYFPSELNPTYQG